MGVIELIEDAYFKHKNSSKDDVLYLICSQKFFTVLDGTLQRLTPKWGQNFEKAGKRNVLKKIMGMEILISDGVADDEIIVATSRKAE